MHTMNYATSAPAATAGGQQNGPVRYLFSSVGRDVHFARREPFSYPYLPTQSITNSRADLVLTACMSELRYKHHSAMASR